MKKTLMISVEVDEYESAKEWCKTIGAESLEEHLCYNIQLAALMNILEGSQDKKEIIQDLMFRMDMGLGRKSIIKYLREQYQKRSVQ